MKRVLFLLSIVLISSIIAGQDNVSKKLLLSLQPGESIVTNESCLNFSATSGLYLVTWQDKQLYVYENGERKGPFEDLKDITIKACGEDQDTECAVFKQQEQGLMQLYIETTDEGTYNIIFKGKTYGPYTYIADFHISADKSMFAAVTANAQMKFTLITSEGLEQKLNGTFERLIISPSGKQFLALVKEGEAIDMSALSNMSEEELMKYVQEQAQKQQDAGESVTQIIGTVGNLYGKHVSSVIHSNNPAYCQTGGDNWYMVINNALYVNGLLLKKFDKSMSVSTCKVWLSEDGKRFALVGYDKILFSDEKSYPPPIILQVEQSGIKTILKWIALENETDLVSYSKEL